MTRTPARLAVVVKGWPRLSETFIAQELVALEAISPLLTKMQNVKKACTFDAKCERAFEGQNEGLSKPELNWKSA